MPKNLKEVKQTKPLQLSLFEILTETDVLTEEGGRLIPKGKNYSQTIELYDFMPRFVWNHQADLRRNYNGLLPALVRDFECRGDSFRLTLTPATLVQTGGDSISYYPGADEDILETVLRKIYIDGRPKLFDGQPGMTFTINQLRKELKKQGHTRSHYQIRASLLILKGAQINCQNLGTGRETAFNTIDVLSFKRDDNLDGDEPCYLIFSKLLADALEGLYFRRFNYKQVVSYKSNVARLLHRRLSHHFTQANNSLTYTINLSTLIRDFGLKYENLTKACKSFEKAFDEMKRANVISEVVSSKTLSPADLRKIEDYHLEITPTKAFSFEIKNSNVIQTNIAVIAENLSENSQPKKRKTSIFPSSLSRKSSQDKKNTG